VHIIHIRHRDEVEAPLTDWLREAYQLPDVLAATGKQKKTVRAARNSRRARASQSRRPPSARRPR
jgi:hypothetical protein